MSEEKYKNLPLVLLILDGWGIAEPNKGNAIALANTPVIDSLSKDYPHTQLCASAKCAGLPPNQVGNSEAGHMNIGAGRLIDQDVVKISKSISDGTFFKNPGFLEAIRHAKKNKSRLHLMGMLSNGMSPHSDPDHILALLILARKKGVKDVYLHLFTDGRDSPQYASLKLVEALERELGKGELVGTMIGRFYSMDRKKKWERTEKTYNALVLGEGLLARSPQAAITESYNKGHSDEFIEPYILYKQDEKTGAKKILPRISDNDSIIFFNLRSDRARQLAKPFAQKNFNKMNPGSFKRKKVLKNVRFVAMTDFGPDLDSILTAYPGVDIQQSLPMVLEDISQLYLAETEKYAHVTYFFNGGYPDCVNGEDRRVIPSPDVKSYDATPAMSSEQLTEIVVDNIKNNKYDFTAVNFAAPDMIGHTGNLEAGITCCEIVDACVGKIVQAYLENNGTVLITADHGNVEKMLNLETGEIVTEHTTNPVPFIVVNKNLKNKIKLREGTLRDIAPTILDLIGKKKPAEMDGNSLIK